MIRSLRAKIIILTLAVSLVPLLLLSVVLLGMSYTSQRNDVLTRQQDNAQQMAQQVRSTLSESEQAMSVLAETSNWQALDSAEQNLIVDTLYGHRLLESADNPWTVFTEILFLDKEGEPVAGKSAFRMLLLTDWAELARETAFGTVAQGQDYWGPVYFGAAEMPAIDIAVPTQDLSGGFTGQLRGAINLDKALWATLTGPGVPQDALVYLFDESGRLIVRNDEHFYERSDLPIGIIPVAKARQGLHEGVETYRGLLGEQAVGAWQPISDTGWTVVVETPTQVAFADVRNLLALAMVVSVVAIIMAVVAGVFASRALTEPIETLRQGAETIGAGNLDHRIRVRSQDEIGTLARTFNRMAASLKTSQTEIEQWGQELEVRVEERTHELSDASERMRRRAVQMQTSAEVARAIASVRDLDQLLSQITQLVSERFGWYHVGIFLLDEGAEYAVLEAANSKGGQRMLARGHRLKVGETGIVGSVTGTGEPLIALDVGENAVYFDTPELHGTRSEMALPLKLGDQIIGALDVQSTEAAAYDEEDVALLIILADQVATAIENARLFEETQHALDEVQALHRQYVEREWARGTSRQQDMAYEYRRRGLAPLGDVLSPEVRRAVDTGQVASFTRPQAGQPEDDGGNGHGDEAVQAALAAPIKIRDQIVGVLDLQESDAPRQWTDDDIALVQSVSDQLGQALETARLFEETSRRAEQMTTLNRIGLDLASGLEMERVLQSLYEQCEQVLSVDTFYVALYDDVRGMIDFPLLTGKDGPLTMDSMDIESPSLTSHVIQSGELLYVPDARNISEDAPYRALPISDLPNRSYVGVPLLSRGQAIGVLSIQSLSPNAYSDEDIELLTTMSTQATIAIENARAYQRLVETADELREVDRLKTQFLANMSHELRTPLNSIIGFSRVMLKGIDGPLTDLQEDDLTSIYSSGQHLLGLINSILDMSKIEAGKMDLSFDEVDLSDIFSTVIYTARGLLKDRPIKLKSDFPEDLPLVWADTQRVRQILINLISNAAKFTETGHIALAASADAEFVTISVSDTGMGIEEEAMNRLFIAFQQVDQSTSRRAGGTGLGLAISRSFVELLGGEIWVESEPGKGSTFSFTLPIYEVVRAKEEKAEEVDHGLDPDNKTVLAVDDDEGVITLLKRYLENDGYRVVGVKESHQAVETAQRLAPGLTAITLDVVMPNMDGWQVLRALKQNLQTQDIPVILCSIVEGLDQGLEMGAVACLRKPVTRDDILEILKQIENSG